VIAITELNTTESAAALIAQAVHGDQRAFASLVRLHHRAVVRVAYVISGSPDVADQAAAATWSIAWKALGKVRDPDKLASWLCSIAANEARQIIRRQRRRSVTEIRLDALEARALADPVSGIADIDLARALARLSPEDRALIALRYVAGLNSTELARAIGISASGTRARLARVLGSLRKDLGDE